MRLKVAQGVSMNQDQVREVANSIMEQPDSGWNYDAETRTARKTGVYDVELQGEHGTYNYRVNLSFRLITLKSVE